MGCGVVWTRIQSKHKFVFGFYDDKNFLEVFNVNLSFGLFSIWNQNWNFLAQYRDLFENTISRLKLHVPQSASPLIVRNITAYFKQRCRYLVRFDDPPVQISEPDRAIVDDLVVYDFEPVECFLTDGFLKGYSNLSSLEMFSELPIEKLPLLANLRKLSVGDVSFPNISRQSWLCFMFLFAFFKLFIKI